MKKFLIFVLSLNILVLSSCSTEKTTLDPKNPEIVTLWHYYNGDSKIAFENKIEEFNQTLGIDKGVIITPTAKGSVKELEEALTNSAKGVVGTEEMPDVFTCYEDKLLELDKLGKIADLNPYLTEEDKEKYVDEFLKTGIQDDGRLTSIPIVKSTEVVYVNKTGLEELGFDLTLIDSWEDYYGLSRNYYMYTDAQTPDVLWDGKSFFGIDNVANYVIASNMQLGVEIFDDVNDTIILNKEVLNKIFSIYYQGMSFGFFNSIGAFRSDDLKAGEILAYAGSSSGASYFPTWIESNGSEKEIELEVDYYPVFENGETYAIQQGAGMSISKSTENKQEGATIFLKWMTEPEQNIDFALVSGYLPVEESAYNDKLDSAVSKMLTEDMQKINIASVYDTSLVQILNLKTYAPSVFENSYNVRNILGETLIAMGEVGKEEGTKLKAQGLTEDEILINLNMDEKFEIWIESIEKELIDLGVEYILE